VISGTKAAISLGSNLGDRLGHLRAGMAGLKLLGYVRDVSSLYETAPIGDALQDPYLNAVAVVETGLRPRELLGSLLDIEQREGRVRTEKWGPRTLDLDLVLFGAERIEQPDLVVPHPRAHVRRFVLDPLAEVWPDARLHDRTAKELAVGLSDQDVVLVARHWVI
jgi:2-amino-4-hydroxy-6-hydroxymethyldihydropteridine diphosphokinase